MSELRILQVLLFLLLIMPPDPVNLDPSVSLIPGRGTGHCPDPPGSSTDIPGRFGSGGWTRYPSKPGCELGSVAPGTLLMLQLCCSVDSPVSFMMLIYAPLNSWQTHDTKWNLLTTPAGSDGAELQVARWYSGYEVGLVIERSRVRLRCCIAGSIG